MIDIHSHIIFNVDDGSRSLDESLNIINTLYNEGIKDIIITPHYINDSKYMSSIDNNKKILNILKNNIDKDINLYLGNEIFIDHNIYELLDKNKVSTLNNTKYVLVELPMSGIYPGYQDILYNLKVKGYKVILAHPERYISFQKDINKIYELKDMGILFQSNYGSLLGDYGFGAKRCIKKLMKEKLITYMSTDIHRNRRKGFINKAINKMKKYYKDSEIEDLISNNAKELINRG